MAAPVWQSRTTLTGSADTSAIVTLPSSLAANDIVLVILYKENINAVTPPAGYSEEGTAPTTTAPQAQHIFWYRAAGGESGTVTFSWTGSVFRAATAHRITGCITTGDPIEGINTNASNASVSTLNVSLASTSADSLLVWAGTDFAGGNTWTPPTGYTEQSDIDVIGDATKTNAAGGATGSVTGTANVSGAMTAILLSLLPAAADSPGQPINQNPLTPFPRLQLAIRQASLWRPIIAGDEIIVTGTNAAAENATATGTVDASTRTISTGSQLATGTGTANNPQPAIAGSAGAAAGTGTANTTTSLISTGPTTATATGVAQTPSPSVKASADVATATGIANSPTVTTGAATNAPAGVATATGAAQAPSIGVAPTAGAAIATSATQNTAAKIATGPSTATAAGAANNATISTGSSTNAAAGAATATGTANGATITRAVAAQAGTATATGTVAAPRWSLLASAHAALALASALDAQITGAETNADSDTTVAARRGSTTTATGRRTASTMTTSHHPAITTVTGRADSTPEVTD